MRIYFDQHFSANFHYIGFDSDIQILKHHSLVPFSVTYYVIRISVETQHVTNKHSFFFIPDVWVQYEFRTKNQCESGNINGVWKYHLDVKQIKLFMLMTSKMRWAIYFNLYFKSYNVMKTNHFAVRLSFISLVQ